MIVKSLDDNKHIGSASFMIFLGAGPEDLHTSPWFVWSGITSTLAFLSALLLYKILKARCYVFTYLWNFLSSFVTLWLLLLSRTHQHGILSANTTSRMESSANGKRLFVVGLRLDLYTFYTLGINSIFGCRLHGYGIIIFRVDILWHSRGCFDGHPLDLLHLFLDIG